MWSPPFIFSLPLVPSLASMHVLSLPLPHPVLKKKLLPFQVANIIIVIPKVSGSDLQPFFSIYPTDRFVLSKVFRVLPAPWLGPVISLCSPVLLSGDCCIFKHSYGRLWCCWVSVMAQWVKIFAAPWDPCGWRRELTLQAFVWPPQIKHINRMH